jgi:hypothetical protein
MDQAFIVVCCTLLTRGAILIAVIAPVIPKVKTKIPQPKVKLRDPMNTTWLKVQQVFSTCSAQV